MVRFGRLTCGITLFACQKMNTNFVFLFVFQVISSNYPRQHLHPRERGLRSYIQKGKREKHINNFQTTLSLNLNVSNTQNNQCLVFLLLKGLNQHSDFLNNQFASVIYSYRLNSNFKWSFYNCLLLVIKRKTNYYG